MEHGSEQLHEVRVSRGLSRPCPKVTPCTCSSHSGKKFLPLDGIKWETLVLLPVTPKPSPIVIGAKSPGARGISEEMEESATVKSGSRNMAIPFQAEHLGYKGELPNEQEQLPLSGFVFGQPRLG